MRQKYIHVHTPHTQRYTRHRVYRYIYMGTGRYRFFGDMRLLVYVAYTHIYAHMLSRARRIRVHWKMSLPKDETTMLHK